MTLFTGKMKMPALLILIRPVNLLIIALTQWLLRTCVFSNYYSLNGAQPALSVFHFYLLMAATLFIAAGGYIINDYFDRDKDMVNKPDRRLIGSRISNRAALAAYFGFTAAGVLTGFYLDRKSTRLNSSHT